MLIDEIKQRLKDINCEYDKMNSYQLYFDCKALISELDYWKDRAITAKEPHKHKYILVDFNIAECECGHIKEG